MVVNSENWIMLLREEIIDRGSLYPDSDIIPGINANNWLLFLRDDILARGTLYPDGEGDVGGIEPNNWLVKLRDDILERGSLYPNVDAPDPILSGLSVQGLSIQPPFNSDIFEYAAGTTSAQTTSMTIAYDPQFTAVCYFNNTRYNPGSTVTLIEGLNTFRVEISNINKVKNIYNISIAYTPPSTFMSDIQFSDVDNLSPGFNPVIQDYTALASSDASSMNFSTDGATASASATLNDSVVPLSGVGPFSGTLNFNAGSNVLIIGIKNGTATERKYTFTISL